MYESLKKSELQALCTKRGINFGSDDTNAELRKLLLDFDAAQPLANDSLADESPAEAKDYVVQCNCPTPLAQNPYMCSAVDEADALRQFFAANGISGSDHKITVTPI